MSASPKRGPTGNEAPADVQRVELETKLRYKYFDATQVITRKYMATPATPTSTPGPRLRWPSDSRVRPARTSEMSGMRSSCCCVGKGATAACVVDGRDVLLHLRDANDDIAKQSTVEVAA